ncbi:hypothetical protein O181_027828 [Austropuccinia psidii MF-1]|uniref:CCHC-type domain-containing protein n=1 Tax=Austropuccinia psidii MF-1 TaxID=1389203 RepID=A0A9Q3CSJ4_9BASI|nr:hypothetical protein [Austropuccinia psidii MF-1]
MEEKDVGSLVILLENRNLAYDIIKGGDLLFEGNLLQVARYQPGLPQCYNCLYVGHLALTCKNKPMCIKCGEEHTLRECKSITTEQLVKTCAHCKNTDKTKSNVIDDADLKYHHSAYSSYCPIKKAELDSFNNIPSPSSQ